MILADEPAYDLPPIARALKFDDFDRLCVRLVNDLAAAETNSAPDSGERQVPRHPSRTPAAANSSDDWTDTATDPGGYQGEIELTPVGAVPVAEI